MHTRWMDCLWSPVVDNFAGTVGFLPEKLLQPFSWKKPRRIWVSDIFAAREDQIGSIFGVMAGAPQHTFLVCTTYPEAMCRMLTSDGFDGIQGDIINEAWRLSKVHLQSWRDHWPLGNVWLGVRIPNREQLRRLSALQATPAALRFISFEPLLEDMGDISEWLPSRACSHYPGQDACANCRYDKRTQIGWVLIGGESGRKARPCNIAWIRHLVQQCQAAGVATWVNQLGSKSYREWPAHHGRPNPWSEFLQLRDARGADITEWDEDLQIRQRPEGGTDG